MHEASERTAGLLQDNPRLGHPGRVADTRELVVPEYPTYIIVYELHGSRIHILAVMHGGNSLSLSLWITLSGSKMVEQIRRIICS